MHTCARLLGHLRKLLPSETLHGVPVMLTRMFVWSMMTDVRHVVM